MTKEPRRKEREYWRVKREQRGGPFSQRRVTCWSHCGQTITMEYIYIFVYPSGTSRQVAKPSLPSKQTNRSSLCARRIESGEACTLLPPNRPRAISSVSLPLGSSLIIRPLSSTSSPAAAEDSFYPLVPNMERCRHLHEDLVSRSKTYRLHGF